MTIDTVQFGRTPDGQTAELFTLTNAGGLVAKITNYGGILVEMRVPDRRGKLADVVLGLDTLDDYLAGHPMFGAICGRVANRIAGGRFTLDGKTYTLAINNGPNHLHGGIKGFDKYIWQAEITRGEGGPAVKLVHHSPDGDEGYPGNVTATAVYTLSDDNALMLEMTATSDAPTPVNLANHSYWNLAGHRTGDALDHEMMVHADCYTAVDDTLIPTGELAPVAGTPLDFTSPAKVGARIGELDATATEGYDHNFVLRGEIGKLKCAARAVDPASGRVMELHTTAPGMQLYTANHLTGPMKGKRGAVYHRRQAFCLETQHFPDSVNHANFPTTILRPGQTYHHVMIHRFSTV